MSPALNATQRRLLAKLPPDGSEVRTDSLTHAAALAKRGLVQWRFTEKRRNGRLILAYFVKITPLGLSLVGQAPA